MLMTSISDLKEIKLSELKRKSAADLMSLAEELEVENASSLRKQAADRAAPVSPTLSRR